MDKSLTREREAYDRIAGHLDEIGKIIFEMNLAPTTAYNPTLEELLDTMRKRDMERLQDSGLSKRDGDLFIAVGINVIERLGSLREAVNLAGWGIAMILQDTDEDRS